MHAGLGKQLPKGKRPLVLNVIFNSDLFRSQSGNARKNQNAARIRRECRARFAHQPPAAGFTATTDGYSSAHPLDRMGSMKLFDRDAPDGYPETGPNWISAGTLVERIRFIRAFLNSGTGDDAGNHTCDPSCSSKPACLGELDRCGGRDRLLPRPPVSIRRRGEPPVVS